MNSKIVQDEVVYDGAVYRAHKIALRMDTGELHDAKSIAAVALWRLREES